MREPVVNKWKEPGPWTTLELDGYGKLLHLRLYDHCPGPIERDTASWRVLRVEPGLVVIQRRGPVPGYHLYIRNT